MKKNTLKGALVASAVAGMFVVVGCSAPSNTNNTNTNTSTKTFKCEGGNSCKGQGECKTATHDCAGKGDCHGTGWVMTKDQAECDTLKAKNKP